MRKVAFTISTLLVATLTFAQKSTLEVNISREDYSITEINTPNEKFTLIETGNTLATQGDKYEFSRGKGGDRDESGIRERQKNYLLNSNQDTIAIFLHKEEQIKIQNTVLNIEKTEDGGWEYISPEGELYCSLVLFWNKSTWKYTLNLEKKNSVTEVLQKVILLSLVNMAIEESKCDSNDSNSALWFSLYALSLAQK